MFEQLGLIGCGLMGGSFALALKKAGLVGRVVGYSKSPSTTERALALGVIDAEASSALQAVQGSDLVLLAVPVAATEATLASIRHLVTPGMLIMDVGSTKADVVQAARAGLGDRIGSFVPAHPITGKEVAGVEHAEAGLYTGSHVVLTPTEHTHDALLEQARRIWQALGCQVHGMTPEAHDATLATVSHLPHLLAFAMMQSVLAQPDADATLALAGPGFRDFTRIAAGNPQIWRDILLANREQVLAQARQFREALDQLEALVHAGDGPGLQEQITRASTARAGWRMGAPRMGAPRTAAPATSSDLQGA
ncbi:prephenate dehydrogenase [Comamonas endophytica]|uniref:Prephenate dehydrogenase/arogenate dehydrogenase family protein n=1 Tax=Comamonas endophytica TaxID=2949090 RepID=A0ABY6G8D6_9BURK|nr:MULTISPECIES: prephenate dehydrogenase/arogenate dehydrogenase family protein [unclassified Acidovorax]MCD2514157.1 prephenate dehydrogenase/arogenate dehydrogenase family protein [Acidovorax sp. D4N7]UYG51297.1 prephenate dehydrogenase/arogenate dehydrogenase family protein [Acidovorax sp. 5MLIR]